MWIVGLYGNYMCVCVFKTTFLFVTLQFQNTILSSLVGKESACNSGDHS